MARGRKPRNSDAAEAAREHLNGADDDGPSEQHNSAARADTIRAAVRYIANAQAEIKALREDLNEYKQKHIKGDLGMKLSDFAAVYRVSQLEVEDRDKLLDTLHEGFAALGLGGQLNWLDAAEGEGERADA
jgi:hypothetical protein